MRRTKPHKVKKEKPETSTSLGRDKEEHDLAYYIHDRVELMHQVFSCIKYKELKAIAPECVAHISIDDLQELCTEELLGISSKRLCAILDGAEPPSDTDSSSSPSPDNLETISLDSISSDEEILSQGSSKKSKKHKHRRGSKSKSKRKKTKESEPATGAGGAGGEVSRASRAGLTVLELLELQARARAIRAQLQQEHHTKQVSETAAPSSQHSSDGEVEIKEEPAEVVEISSDDEKPKIEKLLAENPVPQEPQAPAASATVTKRVSDLIITVPQTKPARKIKLNRNKAPIPVPVTEKITSVATNQTVTNTTEPGKSDAEKGKKDKIKKKKKDKKKKVDKDDDDHDEITLQLSDTEKMDLLEDLDRKSFDNVTSMDSDSSSDTDSDSPETNVKIDKTEVTEKSSVEIDPEIKEDSVKTTNDKQSDMNKINDVPSSPVKETISDPEKSYENIKQTSTDNNINENNGPGEETSDRKSSETENNDTDICEVVENPVVDTGSNVESSSNFNIKITISDRDRTVTLNTNKSATEIEKNSNNESTNENVIEITKISDIPIQESEQDTPVESATKESETGDTHENSEVKEGETKLSDGELSDKESSEVEAIDLKPEVVCISDDEKETSQKKKKKKEKKSKKVKKSKKKDFRESADQNFFKEAESDKQTQETVINIDKQLIVEKSDITIIENVTTEVKQTHNEPNINKQLSNDESAVMTTENDAVTKKQTDTTIINENTDDKCEIITIHNETIDDDTELETIDLDEVYEILELSDDSSCYEVEGTVLSKEPTAEEIEALSAKIDEIERVDVVTEQEIKEYENEVAEVENISWKDRYLESSKVKKVLTTANIFNALRKKNIELKKKIEESKKEIESKKDAEEEVEIEIEQQQQLTVVEGTIEHYNMLQGSTKYVDPVSEVTKSGGEEKEGDNEKEGNGVTKEMKKDAKQLLKMYKRLLKYNDMDKQKDPKKKKKKKKEKKDSDTVKNKVL